MKTIMKISHESRSKIIAVIIWLALGCLADITVTWVEKGKLDREVCRLPGLLPRLARFLKAKRYAWEEEAALGYVRNLDLSRLLTERLKRDIDTARRRE